MNPIVCPRLAVLAAFVAGALALAACSGDATPPPTSSLSPSSTVAIVPTATATALGPPRPTSTPYPTATRPPASGRVLTRSTVACELGAYGPEIIVQYHVSIHETDNPEAVITRLRVFVNGSVVDDTGPIAARSYDREFTLAAGSSRLYQVLLRSETRGAPQPDDVLQFAPCPPASDEPRA